MIYVFLAEGFEELEAIAPVDLLKRVGMINRQLGLQVQTVGVGGKTVVGRSGIAVTCDITEDGVDAQACTAVILPGGPGRGNLARSRVVLQTIEAVARHGGLLAAICGSPPILGKHLAGRKACCHDSVEDEITNAEIVYDPVVTDGNVITSRGAGTSIAFALAIAEYLAPAETVKELARQIVYER